LNGSKLQITKRKQVIKKMTRLIKSNEKGMVLILTLLVVLVLLSLGGVYLLISQVGIQKTALEESYVSALSIAKVGAKRAILKIKNEWINNNKVWTEGFGSKEIPHIIKDGAIEVGSYYVTVEDLGKSMNSLLGTLTHKLKITSIGRKGKARQMIGIHSAVRGIEVIAELIGSGVAVITSDVFDYAYFLNNWAWWGWEGGNVGDVPRPREWVKGDMRSNGRFDFWPVGNNSLPTRVAGNIWANFEIDEHFEREPYHSHLRGAAGSCDDHAEGEIVYPWEEHHNMNFQHPNAGRGNMPNLQNPQYYRNLATGTVEAFLPGHIVINGVFGDDEPQTDVVLIGSAEHPIRLNGPIYVERDVIIKGHVTGQGTIYAGRNVYIAGNITYTNPPVDEEGRPSYYPQTTNPNGIPTDAQIQAWYNRNVNADVLAIAAAESIIVGDYPDNKWSDGDPYWWPAWYGLFDMGSEDVGADGIPDTNDIGENNGIFERETEDLDGDGIFDQVHQNRYGENYNWRDVTTTGLPYQQSDWIDGTGHSHNYANRGGARHYHDLVDFGGISRLDGIFYTQHFLAGTFVDMPAPWKFSGAPFICNGSLISKDECIVYYPMFNLNYDWRIHSRYRKDQKNWPINLHLPPTVPGGGTSTRSIRIISWKEVKP